MLFAASLPLLLWKKGEEIVIVLSSEPVVIGDYVVLGRVLAEYELRSTCVACQALCTYRSFWKPARQVWDEQWGTERVDNLVVPMAVGCSVKSYFNPTARRMYGVSGMAAKHTMRRYSGINGLPAAFVCLYMYMLVTEENARTQLHTWCAHANVKNHCDVHNKAAHENLS